MSKMSELAMTIEELRNSAAAINESVNWLAEHFRGVAEEPVNEPAVKIEEKLTLEDIRAVLADKSRAGYTAAIRSLLQKYGASKLSSVDPKHYEFLLKDAEKIGNGC